jgi:hypothetical protein
MVMHIDDDFIETCSRQFPDRDFQERHAVYLYKRLGCGSCQWHQAGTQAGREDQCFQGLDFFWFAKKFFLIGFRAAGLTLVLSFFASLRDDFFIVFFADFLAHKPHPFTPQTPIPPLQFGEGDRG